MESLIHYQFHFVNIAMAICGASRLALIIVVVAMILGSDNSLNAFGESLVRPPSGIDLAYNHFGLNLFKRISAENDAKSKPNNVFFSPYSVATAMAMLHRGAASETARQFDSTLGFSLARLDQLDRAQIGDHIRKSGKTIFGENITSAGYTLRSGNALLVDRTFAPLPAYRQSLIDNFAAEALEVDFANEAQAVMQQINGWVSNRTEGKITKLLTKPLSPSTQMAVMNAIYFKGQWKNQFNADDTMTDTFTGRDGTKHEQVQFMFTRDDYNVARLDELQSEFIELSYGSENRSQVSMFAILPDSGVHLPTIKQALNPWYVEAAISRLFRREIRLRFPKFEFETEYDLERTLESMGIVDAFNRVKADFSQISTSPLAVDMVRHMATIEVNERGSEASAATIGMEIALSGYVSLVDPPLISFDRPFVFLIRHNPSGQILFIGEVNKF